MSTTIDLLLKLYLDLGGSVSDLDTTAAIKGYNTTDGLLYLIGFKINSGGAAGNLQETCDNGNETTTGIVHDSGTGTAVKVKALDTYLVLEHLVDDVLKNSLSIKNGNEDATDVELQAKESGDILVGTNASGVYSETITFTATTAPSGATNHSYRWTKTGNLVTLRVIAIFATNGTGVLKVTLPLPAGAPQPVTPSAGFGGSAIEIINVGSANVGDTMTAVSGGTKGTVEYGTGAVKRLAINQSPGATCRIFNIIVQYFTA